MTHRYDGLRVSDILRLKRGGVRQAPLPTGSPSWSEIAEMTWEEIVEGAQQNKPGFKTIRKLLTDMRFDK